MNSFENYSSSSSDDVNTTTTAPKRATLLQGLPPPPNGLLSNATPEKLPPVVPHQSREDKYLVHVCLPIDLNVMSTFTKGLMSQTRLRMVGQPTKASFTELSDYHVSISRPVTIRYARIPQLIDDLKKSLYGVNSFELLVHNHVTGFLNSNLRRLFVAAPVSCSADSNPLLQLVKIVDNIFRQHELPVFFKNPKPHVSFAWSEVTDVYHLYKDYRNTLDRDSKPCLRVNIRKAVCTIGKSSFNFPLV